MCCDIELEPDLCAVINVYSTSVCQQRESTSSKIQIEQSTPNRVKQPLNPVKYDVLNADIFSTLYCLLSLFISLFVCLPLYLGGTCIPEYSGAHMSQCI